MYNTGDLYSCIPATTIECANLDSMRFKIFTFTVYPRERSYNEIKKGKELPYDHLMTMEVDSLLKVSTPEYYRDCGK